MSYEGGGSYGQDFRGRRGRGRRSRATRGAHYGYDQRNMDFRQDNAEQNYGHSQGYAQGGNLQNQQHHEHKEVDSRTRARVKEELAKETVEKRTYTKFQLLEMFSSIEVKAALKLMSDTECTDIIVDHSQTPVLLEEAESELTLEELRPKKGMGGPRKRGK